MGYWRELHAADVDESLSLLNTIVMLNQVLWDE
jgi:hypothetical protein